MSPWIGSIHAGPDRADHEKRPSEGAFCGSADQRIERIEPYA
jgi:hypothetical protein